MGVHVRAGARALSLIHNTLFSKNGVFFSQQKQVDHSPQSIAEVKNEWGYTSTPPRRLHGADKDNFTFNFV
jgi:hypothetical protein